MPVAASSIQTQGAHLNCRRCASCGGLAPLYGRPCRTARQTALRQPRCRILAALASQRRNPQPDLGRPTSPVKEKRGVLREKWRAGGRGDGATMLAGGTSKEDEGRAACSDGWGQIYSRHMRMRGSRGVRAGEEHAGMEAAPSKRVDER